MRTSFPSTIVPAVFLFAPVLLLNACAGSGEEKRVDDEAVVAPPAEAVAAPTASTPGRSFDEVQKAFDARKEAFRRVNSARLSQHAGTIAVTLSFAPSGEVVECRMLSTDFRDDPAFNAAVMAEVWRVRVAARADVPEVSVASYPITFSARSEASAAPQIPPPAPPP